MATTHQQSLSVGQLVHVQARTWPGINQPGGVGRITGAHKHHVSVRYILDGRHEKEIDIRYVQLHNQQSRRNLRDRSMLLGRCRNCGSLRKDCGSCDVVQPEWMNNDSSSDDSLKEILQEIDGRFAKHMKLKARASRLQADLAEENLVASTKENDRAESSDDDDSILQELTQEVDTRAKVDRQRTRLQKWTISSPNERRKRRLTKRQDERSQSGSTVEEPVLAHARVDDKADSPHTVASKASSSLLFASPDIDGEEEEEELEKLSSLFDQQAESVSDTFMEDDGNGALVFAGDEFIQPEGDADQLPYDVQDQARRVPYGELATFFDRMVAQLEDDKVPKARSRLMNLERQ